MQTHARLLLVELERKSVAEWHILNRKFPCSAWSSLEAQGCDHQYAAGTGHKTNKVSSQNSFWDHTRVDGVLRRAGESAHRHRACRSRAGQRVACNRTAARSAQRERERER